MAALPRRWRSGLLVAAILSPLGILSGCALTSKADALSPRYFSPEQSRGEAAPARSEEGADPLELRLGQMASAAHLEERIAYRLSETELGYYEDRRWTEPPDEYLRRALSHELFERRGISRIVSGVAPTLDVELVSFEELRQGKPRARLALSFSLREERRVLIERTVVVEEPFAIREPEQAASALTQALSRALARAVEEVADQVLTGLRALPPPAPSTPPEAKSPEAAPPEAAPR